MEANKELFQIYKSEEDKTDIIMKHVLLMLSRRIFIDKSKEKQSLLNLPDSKVEDIGDNTFSIKVRNGEKFAIKIIYHKITTIGKHSVISEFIKNYVQEKKIIVANDFSSKIYDFSIKNGVQLFRECSMLEDIISYRDQPTFELLSPSEMAGVKSEYNVTNYTLNKVQKTDIIVKYFGLKKSDVYRIVRPSPTSGYSTAYRIVA